MSQENDLSHQHMGSFCAIITHKDFVRLVLIPEEAPASLEALVVVFYADGTLPNGMKILKVCVPFPIWARTTRLTLLHAQQIF